MHDERTVYRFEHPCTECGGVAKQAFAEERGATGLVWWESWHCETCGSAQEGDGIDRLPDELRAVVIQAEGSFRVDVFPRDKVGVIRILRTTFGMSLPDAAHLYGLLPHGFRTELTLIEAECVAAQFPAEIAKVLVVPEKHDR